VPSRRAAAQRLREHGKDPRFFETSIFQRTSWEVMRELSRNGLRLYDRMNTIPMRAGTLLKAPRQFLDFYNPMRPSVELSARKPA